MRSLTALFSSAKVSVETTSVAPERLVVLTADQLTKVAGGLPNIGVPVSGVTSQEPALPAAAA